MVSTHHTPAARVGIHPVYARLLRMLLERSDVNSEQVLASARLQWDTLLTDPSRLEPSTVASLVQAAMAASGKPWLGLDLGWQMPISAHGDLAYAAVTAPHLGEALAMLVRYSALRDDTFVWTLNSHPQGATLLAVQGTDWGSANAFIMDTVVAAVLRVVEVCVGQWPSGVRLNLPQAKPTWAAQYSRVSPLEVCFDQPSLSLSFDRATLALPCIGSDAQAHSNACRACDAELAAIASANYTQKVARLLSKAGAGRYPQLEAVAVQCGVSPRTLMRHLRAEGSAFQTLLDTDRKGRARLLLLQKGLSVEEIAAQLGFADTSNFSRTVRRWFGVTPRALRESAP